MIEAPEGTGTRRATPVAGDVASGSLWADSAAAGRTFDSFCREHYAAVTGLAYVLSGSRSAAEDLTQDAFFAAFRQWGRLSAYDNPGAWVRRVVANKAVSRRRRLQSESRALLRIGSRRPQVAELEPRDFEFWAVVRDLPPRQAQVFALTCLEDLPLAAVGEILAISDLTAKTHLQRARAALKRSLPVEPTEPTEPAESAQSARSAEPAAWIDLSIDAPAAEPTTEEIP